MRMLGFLGVAALALALPLLAGAPAQSSGAPSGASLNDRMRGDLFPVHDPAIILAGKYFYVLSTSQAGEAPGLIHIRRSTDLVNWSRAGAVFTEIPAWAKKRVVGTKGIWAPDIVKVRDQYRVYYSVSTFGKNDSAIGMVSNPTLDPAAANYRWTDHGEVVGSTIRDDYNAIDPNVVSDAAGRHWLSFGSFWSGLKMIELDRAKGKPRDSKAKLISIAARATPGAIEAPFIIRRSAYYYQFASFDSCCRGAKSTYYTVVGRSAAVTGPYVDARGRKMTDGAGEVVLHAKLDKSKRWVGPGHPAIIMQGDKAIIAYHAYDVKNGGRPTLRIQSLGWSKDGWPVAL